MADSKDNKAYKYRQEISQVRKDNASLALALSLGIKGHSRVSRSLIKDESQE